jgi:hypothetical protein
MPTQDQIMDQIYQLVSEGAGVPLTSEVKDALHDRYYDWIKSGKKGATISPQKIWEEKDGKGLQKKFREIGEHLAKQAHHGKRECMECYSAVEAASALECPYCPDPPAV